jgi:hypothetical protein
MCFVAAMLLFYVVGMIPYALFQLAQPLFRLIHLQQPTYDEQDCCNGDGQEEGVNEENEQFGEAKREHAYSFLRENR